MAIEHPHTKHRGAVIGDIGYILAFLLASTTAICIWWTVSAKLGTKDYIGLCSEGLNSMDSGHVNQFFSPSHLESYCKTDFSLYTVCIYVNGCKHENTHLLRAALGFQAQPPLPSAKRQKLSKRRGRLIFWGTSRIDPFSFEYFFYDCLCLVPESFRCGGTLRGHWRYFSSLVWREGKYSCPRRLCVNLLLTMNLYVVLNFL